MCRVIQYLFNKQIILCQGGKEVGMLGGESTTMQLCGSGIFLPEAAARLPRPPPQAPCPGDQRPAGGSSEEARKSKAGGLLTIEPEVNFPATAVGKSEVEKVGFFLLLITIHVDPVTDPEADPDSGSKIRPQRIFLYTKFT